MKHPLVLQALSRCAQLLRPRWRLAILSHRCISKSPKGTITLKDAFLGSAEELRLELLFRRPFWMSRKEPALGIRLMSRKSGEPILNDLRVAQLGKRRLIALRVSLPQRCWVNQESLYFEIVMGSPAQILTRLAIPVLNLSAIQQRLVDNLRVSGPRLWVSNRAGCWIADAVTTGSGSLVPEFTIQACQLSVFIPPVEVVQTLELVSSAGSMEVDRRKIRIGSDDLKYYGPAMPLDDTRVFAQPGQYSLISRIEGRELARTPFQLLSEAELLHRVEVSRVQINAETRTGESVPGITTLRWEEHKGFRAAIDIKSEITAPAVLVPCTTCIRNGSTVLQQEQIVFPLDRTSRTVKLQPVWFGGSGLQTQPKPARLNLAVSINGDEKASTFVLVLPPERITNFEGQLSFEVKELPFDELEYRQIIQRLGVKDPQVPSHGFWRWIQSRFFRECP